MGVSAFTLKVVAIVAMTCNHGAYVLNDVLPDSALFVMYTVGGLTFPIMAFLLVEGYRHTSDVRRYGLRLLVFAVISQVPFWVFLAHEGNVLFTLWLSLVALYLFDRVNNRALFWVVFAVIVGASAWCDWGVFGPIMVLMMRSLPGDRERVMYPVLMVMVASGVPQLAEFAATLDVMRLPFALYALLGCGADIPLLLAYDGRRGRPMKWFFYGYYPGHIALLGLVALALGVPVAGWW